MKYIICILCLSLITVGFVGCSSASTAPTPDEEIISIPETTLPVTPADAAMYRGVVSKYAVNAQETTFTLTEYEGTDFGKDTIDVLVTDNSMITQEIVDGDYLEIFHGNLQAEKVSPISVKKLAPAEIANFNGKLVEIIKNEGKTDYLISQLGNEENMIVFHINDTTQLYFDEANLKPGDALNVFHSGAVTMSLPGQGNAIEVRMFAE